MNSTDPILNIIEDSGLKPETRDLVAQLIDELRRILSDHDIDQAGDILASGHSAIPSLGNGGGVVVIPGSGTGYCAPIVLALAKTRDSRSQYGMTNVLREVRAHLIHCFEIAEVVVLLTDCWDPIRMKESVGDFAAYASRNQRRKILLPLVTWKGKLTAYPWP